jgi:hypothetical protein
LVWHNADMKEQAHSATEFLGFGGESGTEAFSAVFTDDQEPQWGDLVVLENVQGKVFCTMESDANTLREAGLKVLRVSRITYL